MFPGIDNNKFPFFGFSNFCFFVFLLLFFYNFKKENIYF